MKQYTRKQLKEYVRLGLARDLTEVDPDTLPKWYEKIGVSRGIYGMNGGLIWDKVTGEIIRLCACKVSPVNVWGVYVDCQKEEFPHIGNDGFNTIVPRNREFETVVNAFRRYNCNYEIGYYPAYYVKAVQL